MRGRTARRTGRSRLGRFVLVAVLLGTSALVQRPAHAVGTTELQFEGTASLPRFPCPVGAGCTGEFHGLLTGQMKGTTPAVGGGEATWTAVLADADIDSTFAYEDTSCVFGTALGTGTLAATAPNMIGTYDDGGPFPRKVQGMDAQVSMSWQRAGANAVLFFDHAVLFLDVVGLGRVQVTFDGSGTGTAAFAPVVHPGEPPPPCTQTPPPLNAPPAEATVVGTVVIAE